MKRASDWEIRITHEAQLHTANCFVTLTYARNELPQHGSLSHREYQLFMKRLRKAHATGVRFYMCGEYGPETQRPHYHACLFGIDFPDKQPTKKSHSGHQMYESKTLDQLWKHGKATIQDLVPETASYCARYIMTKPLGESAKHAHEHLDTETGEIIKKRPEYAAMSLKPGIGAQWLNLYRNDVYKHDYVIARNIKRRPPKFYDRKQEQHNPAQFEQLQHQRELNARKTYADQTPERLAVRETVHKAKIQTLSRNIDHDAQEPIR